MINDIKATKADYEDRIIAFIDILGFRTMINATIKEDVVQQDKLKELIDGLSLMQDEFNKVIKDSELPYSFMITYFSDSIVLSVKRVNSLGLLTVFEILKKIQIKLIERKILLRGGIVIGKLIHTPGLILGPAMNEAYDLESKSALYPRITIDPEVMELAAQEHELQDGLFSIKEYDFQKTFEVDFDNTYYIDYFSDIKGYLEDGDEIKYYQNLRALIRYGVDRKDIGIRMKYMWMLRKFNNAKPSHIKDMKYKELDDINNQILNKS
ncbi:MAG: hypothetical protein WKF66_16195 [Pedobacter sp.]